MVGSCLTVAYGPDYAPVWTGKGPADFGPDLAKVQTGYGVIVAKAALAAGAGGGAADAKALAEGVLEDTSFVLTRALANHFKKTGDLDRLAKVNLRKSALVLLRNRDLVAKATEIHDLGAAAQGEPGAAGRGVTAARVAEVGAAISAFAAMMNNPRGQIVNRSTLLKEVETDTAGLLEQVNDLDDLVLQFDGTPEGRRFVEAWKRARIIVDVGCGHGGSDTPPAPPAAPTTPAQ